MPYVQTSMIDCGHQAQQGDRKPGMAHATTAVGLVRKAFKDL